MRFEPVDWLFVGTALGGLWLAIRPATAPQVAGQTDGDQAQPNAITDGFVSAISATAATIETTATALTGVYLTRGLRNNNPGNIRGNAANPWVGQTGVDNTNYATFDNMQNGVRAMVKTLFTYHDRYNLNSIREIIERWAPAADNNNTVSYVFDVSKRVGVGPETPLDLHDYGTMSKLIHAIVFHENGYDPLSDDLVYSAIADARNS